MAERPVLKKALTRHLISQKSSAGIERGFSVLRAIQKKNPKHCSEIIWISALGSFLMLQTWSAGVRQQSLFNLLKKWFAR